MKKAILTFILVFLLSCGSVTGGSEAGNPTTRTLYGQLSGADASTNMYLGHSHAESTCSADTIIATDSLAQTTMASVSTDCSFTITLAINTAYVISFTLNDDFVGTMLFSTSETATSHVIVLDSGSTEISLGTITFDGTTARPTHEPYEEIDRDKDGRFDYYDDDDDDDGIFDDEEDDCDDDYYPDDYDEDDSCDEIDEEEDDF